MSTEPTPIFDALCAERHAAVRAEMRRQLCADIARAEVEDVVANLVVLLRKEVAS